MTGTKIAVRTKFRTASIGLSGTDSRQVPSLQSWDKPSSKAPASFSSEWAGVARLSYVERERVELRSWTRQLSYSCF
jgi:hypothetical protein